MIARRLPVVFCAVLAAAALVACGADDGDSAGSAGTTLVATTSQVGGLARAVAGDRAHVLQILQPNADPHEYEPRPSDVEAVSGAAVVVRSGGDLDEWLDDVLANAGADARVVKLIEGVKTRRDARGVDPHWWQNPRNAILAVEKIRDALIAADAAGRSGYTANASAYIAKLRALDRAIASCMEAIPDSDRKLVTDHDALGYYADRYDIEVIGTVIPALSTQAQASAGEVSRLVRAIRAHDVGTIFPQSSLNQKLTRAIARDAGARVGPALYADTLGEPGSAGETYLGSLRFNTRALAAGFGGAGDRCRL